MAYRIYTQIEGSKEVKETLSNISMEILESDDAVDRFQIDGRMTRLDPERILTFNKNTSCICCGLEGTIISSERMIGCTHKIYGKAHLNLYGMRGDEKVMLTVDHIVLKSEGGEDSHENYNTMCKDCNTRRGNRFSVLSDFLEMSKKFPIEQYLNEKKHKMALKVEKRKKHEERRAVKIALMDEKLKRQEKHKKMNAERKLEKETRLACAKND